MLAIANRFYSIQINLFLRKWLIFSIFASQITRLGLDRDEAIASAKKQSNTFDSNLQTVLF
jgi:hypothetical protein